MLTVKYRCATERTATELASQVTGPNSQEPRIPSRGAMLGAMMRIRIAAPSDGALVTGAAPPLGGLQGVSRHATPHLLKKKKKEEEEEGS